MELLVDEGMPFPQLPSNFKEESLQSNLYPGLAKSIGVSNFSIKTLTALLEHANIVPAVNQVELHPCLPQYELLEFCRSHNIHLTAYSPVGKLKFASDPAIIEIANPHGITGAQVLLSWGVQRGTSVIPKSLRKERLKENITVGSKRRCPGVDFC